MPKTMRKVVESLTDLNPFGRVRLQDLSSPSFDHLFPPHFPLLYEIDLLSRLDPLPSPPPSPSSSPLSSSLSTSTTSSSPSSTKTKSPIDLCDVLVRSIDSLLLMPPDAMEMGLKRLLGRMEVRKEKIEDFVEVMNKIMSSSHFLSVSSRSLLRSLLVRLYNSPFWDAMGPDNKGDQRVARLLDIKWVDSLSAFFGSDFLRSPILKKAADLILDPKNPFSSNAFNLLEKSMTRGELFSNRMLYPILRSRIIAFNRLTKSCAFLLIFIVGGLEKETVREDLVPVVVEMFQERRETEEQQNLLSVCYAAFHHARCPSLAEMLGTSLTTRHVSSDIVLSTLRRLLDDLSPSAPVLLPDLISAHSISMIQSSFHRSQPNLIPSPSPSPFPIPSTSPPVPLGSPAVMGSVVSSLLSGSSVPGSGLAVGSASGAPGAVVGSGSEGEGVWRKTSEGQSHSHSQPQPMVVPSSAGSSSSSSPSPSHSPSPSGSVMGSEGMGGEERTVRKSVMARRGRRRERTMRESQYSGKGPVPQGVVVNSSETLALSLLKDSLRLWSLPSLDPKPLFTRRDSIADFLHDSHLLVSSSDRFLRVRDLNGGGAVVNGEMVPLTQIELGMDPRLILRLDHNSFLVSFPSGLAMYDVRRGLHQNETLQVAGCVMVTSHPQKPWKVVGSDGLSLTEIDLRFGSPLPLWSPLSPSSSDRITKVRMADDWVGVMTKDHGFFALDRTKEEIEVFGQSGATNFAFCGDSLTLVANQKVGTVSLNEMRFVEPDWIDGGDKRSRSAIVSMDYLSFHDAFLCFHEDGAMRVCS